MSEAIDQAVALHEKSLLCEQAGDLPQAEALCREALILFEREEGPESPDVATILLSLAGILERQGRFAETADYARRAGSIVEPLLPQFEGTMGVIFLLNALGLAGTALRQMGQYDEARGPLERAVELAETIPQHPEELIGALNNLGVLGNSAGAFESGEQAYARALTLARRAFGERHEIVATVLHNIGALAHSRGDYARAEEPSRRAWEIRRALLGEDHPNVLADAVAYASVLDALKRYPESKPIHERALAAYERIYGPEHYTVASTLHNLAVVEQAEGRLDRAIELCRRSLDIKQQVLGIGHADTALSAMNLGAMLLEKGDRGEARRLLAAALADLRRSLPLDHPHIELCQDLLRAASMTRISDDGPA